VVERRRYGPSRGELWFWLVFSGLGLALVAGAILYRGMPSGPALFEVFLLPVGLFGWLGVRSVRRLIRRDHPEEAAAAPGPDR